MVFTFCCVTCYVIQVQAVQCLICLIVAGFFYVPWNRSAKGGSIVSNHDCLPEPLLEFVQMCTVLEFRVLWRFFLWLYLLSPNHLLTKYSEFHFYLPGVGDFIVKIVICFDFPHFIVLVSISILISIILSEYDRISQIRYWVPLVSFLFWWNGL